jgi:hypothetical protein
MYCVAMPSAGYYLEALRAVYIDACTLVPREPDGRTEDSSSTSFTLQQSPSLESCIFSISYDPSENNLSAFNFFSGIMNIKIIIYRPTVFF